MGLRPCQRVYRRVKRCRLRREGCYSRTFAKSNLAQTGKLPNEYCRRYIEKSLPRYPHLYKRCKSGVTGLTITAVTHHESRIKVMISCYLRLSINNVILSFVSLPLSFLRIYQFPLRSPQGCALATSSLRSVPHPGRVVGVFM